MRVLYVMQIVGGCIMAAGYFPQIHQILKTRHVRDLNIRTFISLTIGLSLMEAYAIGLVVHENTGDAFLITNSLGLAMNLLVVALIAYYHRRGPAELEEVVEEQVVEP